MKVHNSLLHALVPEQQQFTNERQQDYAYTKVPRITSVCSPPMHELWRRMSLKTKQPNKA
jgi:hypothetical protein